MRSKLTIVAIVSTVVVLALAVLAGLMIGFGPWRGLALGAAIALPVLLAYRYLVAPRQHRWGATDVEVERQMPGDDLIPHAASTTRAVTIRAAPEEVWPWLVQIGYGRAGWYSYDWIDNDGRPSATEIIADLQNLEVGDQIVMVPGLGPRVRILDPPRTLLAGDEDAGTWCLGLYPDGRGGTRLVSRWRQDWPLTPASAFWVLIADPGAFIMERRMLLGIRDRAERAADGAPPRTDR